MNKRVLITAFDPFGGEAVNAAWEVVRGIDANFLRETELFVRQLPTIFEESLPVLYGFMDELKPDLIVCVGQAGGRNAVSIERLGVNLDDARIADNAGRQPLEQEVIAGGPAAYWSNWPVRDLVAAVQAEGIPAEESYSAGTFVCNHVLYGLMHRLTTSAAYQGVLGGFVHVPYLPAQAALKKNMPSLGADDIRRGIEIIVQQLVAHQR